MLPWRRPAEGWAAAFRRDAETLSKVAESARKLSHAVERLEMSTLDAAGVGAGVGGRQPRHLRRCGASQ